MKTNALVLAIALIAANISHATSLPNLTPYQPSGWSDKIVVTRTSGSTTDSTGLTTADSLYMDWAVINNGATATTNGFYTDLYIDGVHTARFNTPGTLSVGSYASVTAYPIGSFSAGTHTIEIIADSTGLVAESNESDNSYTKTITVGNPPLPNLTPYQPSGWSDKIVVTRTSGSTTDSTGLTSADTLYMDWAVINNGTAATTSGFYSALYIDGVKTATFNTAGTLGVNADATVTGYLLGSFTAGTHTIEITVDSTGLIAESNESDNSYTKTITVGNPPLPNLTPYQPSGWSDKIVVTRTSGSTTDSTGLTTADTLYMDWAVINNGAAATTSGFYTALYIDGVKTATFNTAGTLTVGSYASVTGYSLGSFSAGTHTIEIVADSTGLIAESNESDNSYTKTITVGTPPLPNLTPYQPSGWSDKIVVTRTSNSTTDSTSLTTADTLYMDWAVINNGTAATTSGFYTALYIDGTQTATFNTAGTLGVNADATVTGYPLGSFTAGTHTIGITVDSTGLIAESNESDNSYTKTITIGSSNTVTLFAASVNGLQATINGVVNNSPTNLVWNWGDGQQTAGFFPESHTYSSAGTYTVQVTAQYSNGSTTSSSENVTVMNPPSVSATLSTLTVTPSSAPADGSSQIAATVTLRDIYTNPVSGKTVQFYAIGSVSINQPVNPTDVNGQATATITANTPGTATVTAKDTTDNVAVQQPVTITFTNSGAPIPTPLVLSNAINTFYQETANILDGSVGYNTTTTPSFSVSPIPWIAPDEGQVGDAFEVAAGAAKSAEVIDLAFGFVGVTASPVKIAGQVGLALAQAADNYAADQVDWIAINSDGLSLEAQAVINVASANQNFLLGEKDFFLNTVSQSSANMSALYTNDLQMRLYADYVLITVLGKEDALLDNLQSASKANAINSDLLDVAEVGGALIVIGLTAGTATPLVVALSVGYTSATTGIGEYEDNQSVNDNQKAYLYAFSSMQTCANYSGLVYSNATSAFSQIAQGLAPNPVTGLIIGLQPVVQCNLEPIPTDPLSAFQPKDETTTYQYALIPTYDSSSLVVSNSGSTAATFEVFACYNSAANAFNANTSVPLVNIAAINLNANQSGTLVIPYFDSSYGVRPAEGSTVSMYVLGINATGTFYVASTNITWSTEADAPCLSSGAGGSIATPAAKPHPLDDPDSTTNNTYIIDNPIRYYVAENPDNQTYQEQLSYCNPFFGTLLAVVTQTLPSGITVLSTDGTQVNSSIVWTNILATNTATSGTFTFSLSATPGNQTNLPPPTIVFVDTNTADNFSTAPSLQTFNGLFPVQVSSSIPFAVWGIDSPMLVAVTNLTGTSQTGSLTITLTNSSGNTVANFSQSFSLNGSGGTILNFILPDSLPADSYTLSGSLNINGGTGQVLAGNYVVPAQPVTLGVGSPAIDANGIHIVLNGPPGSNYVITATSNLSDPTTRQAIMFLSPTNTPISITVPMEINASQMFYQAVMQ